MSNYKVKRSRHSGEIKRIDEQTRVSDLPPAAAAHEAPKLLLMGSSLPRRLLLQGAEGSKVSLGINNLFHGGGAEHADQLVLQVVHTHVETQQFHIGASEVGAEAGPLETALEVPFLSRVTKTCQPDIKAVRAVQIQEASNGLRTPNWHDGNALGVKIPATAPSERFDGDLVADPLNEHDYTLLPVHVAYLHCSDSARPWTIRAASNTPASRQSADEIHAPLDLRDRGSHHVETRPNS